MSEDSINLEEAQVIVSRLTKDAGTRARVLFELIKNKGNIQETSKGGVDFTTQADEEIDRFLREQIAEKYPRTQFLTEETAPDDYSKLQEATDLWVIDPIDGTTNFSRGRPHFGISIALVDKGIPKLAVVYLPMQDELYTARRNSPTLLNGKKIHVSKINTLQNAWIESGFSWDMAKRAEFTKNWLSVLSQHVRAFTMSGSSVFDMAKVAQGEIDAFVYCGIKPWDQAATGLLIQNAGGKMTTSKGEPWNVFEKDIVASNGILHKSLLELIDRDF